MVLNKYSDVKKRELDASAVDYHLTDFIHKNGRRDSQRSGKIERHGTSLTSYESKYTCSDYRASGKADRVHDRQTKQATRR